MKMDEAKAELLSWLDLVRQAFCDAALRSGYAPQVETMLPFVEGERGDGYQFSYKPELVNCLTVDKVLRSAMDNIDLSGCAFPPALSEAFDEIIEGRGFYATFLNQVEGPATQLVENTNLCFDSRRADWMIAKVFFPLAQHYSVQVENLGVTDAELARQLIDEAIAFCLSDHVIVELQMPVCGFRFGDEASENGLSVSSLGPSERGYYVSCDETPFRMGKFITAALVPFAPTHEIRIQVPARKATQAFAWFQPGTVLLAFQLLGFQLGTYAMCRQRLKPDWANFGYSSTPTWGTRPFKVGRALTEQDISSVWDLVKKIDGPPRHVTAENHPHSNQWPITVRRFQRAMGRELAEDGLIDCIVGLEAALLPGMNDELSYRFSLHGAYWLASSKEERTEIFNQLRMLYRCRSAVVHGSALPKGQEVSTLADQARNLLARVVIKGLEEGWPSGEDFLSMCLQS